MMLEHSEFYDKLYDLGIDTVNCRYMEFAGVFFDELMKKEFGEDGLDLITWWMYEEVDHVLYDSHDEAKVIADLNNIDNLYHYLAEGGRDKIEGED